MEIIKIENLNFAYPKQEKKALDNINLEIKEGEFIVVCGPSGCGKTTLLKQIKPQLTPFGTKSGIIKYYNKNLNDYEQIKTASEIGYVMQDCNAQIVTDKVWHELAFGLENMGIKTPIIRRRVAEMASFFGIQNWFRKNVNELSGGQKQLLNLAAIMVMQPKLLILDEPTSQLDPIASRDFLDTIIKINRELGTTIIITEHQLENIFPMADRILVMEQGKVLYFTSPREVVKKLSSSNNKHSMFKALPTASRIYNAVPFGDKCPLTVREGKSWLNELFKDRNFLKEEVAVEKIEKKKSFKDKIKDKLKNKEADKDLVVELKDIWFKYDKGKEPTIRNLSFKVHKGEIYCILGGNGAGKTTTLSIISHERKAIKGKVLINNINIEKYKEGSLFKENMAVLPQNPQALFVFSTLKEDLLEIYANSKIDKEEIERNIMKVSETFGISHLLNQHPYDLSGGELQRAGIAKIMLLNPKILLLDEPTKGLDAYAKEEIGKILKKLTSEGITIIMVTHDIEFSAMYADKCALFFDGNIVSEDEPKKFFANNTFYTTAANRMSRGIIDDAVTCEDVIDVCKSIMPVRG